MTTFGFRAAALRDILPAAVLISAAVFFGGVIGNPPAAIAKDGEWDVGEYDLCMTMKEMDRNDPTVPYQPLDVSINVCCVTSGGHYDGSAGPNGTCYAPPAIAASTPIAPPSEAANPDVPTGPPPTKPGPKPLTPKMSPTLAPSAPVG